jgi:hypothetical protein
MLFYIFLTVEFESQSKMWVIYDIFLLNRVNGLLDYKPHRRWHCRMHAGDYLPFPGVLEGSSIISRN